MTIFRHEKLEGEFQFRGVSPSFYFRKDKDSEWQHVDHLYVPRFCPSAKEIYVRDLRESKSVKIEKFTRVYGEHDVYDYNPERLYILKISDNNYFGNYYLPKIWKVMAAGLFVVGPKGLYCFTDKSFAGDLTIAKIHRNGNIGIGYKTSLGSITERFKLTAITSTEHNYKQKLEANFFRPLDETECAIVENYTNKRNLIG